MKASNLVVAFIGLLGVVMGIAASAFWQWTEREDRYRVMIFEKRLEVHQEAVMFNSDIATKAQAALTGKVMPSEAELLSNFLEMRTWWRTNNLYLDPHSRKAFLDLTIGVKSWSESSNLEDAANCFDLAKITGRSIVEGIGQEYLPETEALAR